MKDLERSLQELADLSVAEKEQRSDAGRIISESELGTPLRESLPPHWTSFGPRSTEDATAAEEQLVEDKGGEDLPLKRRPKFALSRSVTEDLSYISVTSPRALPEKEKAVQSRSLQSFWRSFNLRLILVEMSSLQPLHEKGGSSNGPLPGRNPLPATADGLDGISTKSMLSEAVKGRQKVECTLSAAERIFRVAKG